MKTNGFHRGINWNKQPLVRPLILCIAGILCAHFFSDFDYLCKALLFLFLSALFVQCHVRFLNNTLVACLLYFSFYLLGVSLPASLRNSKTTFPEFKNYTLLVKQSSEVVCKRSGNEFKSQFTAEAKSILVDNKWLPIDGMVKFTLKNDSLGTLPGALLMVHSNFWKPANEILPGSFDFERFSRIKSIDALCTINKNQVMSLGKNEQSFVISFIHSIRCAIIRYLKASGFDANQLGIASALLVGYRADIDAELNTAYSKAGIVHVLAVSGMHVSLVFGSVLWLLSRFLKPRTAAVAGILVLWFYALLAGLSPSVMRSACMFSLMAISKLFVKSAVSSNAMAGAAFIMLFGDPQTLYDPGAQLSFAAVWGIYARSTTPSFLYFKNKIIRYVIDSLWVCLVAQLATLPITLWYFGSFPVYFLLANLLAVPFSTGLIYIGFFGLMLFPIDFISAPILEVMKIGIDALNYFTRHIAGLPLSSIEFGRIMFLDALFIGCIIYTVLFPIGSIPKKLYAVVVARLVCSSIFVLTNIKIDKGPNLYFFSCEQTYHFVCVGNMSIQISNIGRGKCHSCKRLNTIKQYAQQEGCDVKIEDRFIKNPENGGKADIRYKFNGKINSLAIHIYPSTTLVNEFPAYNSSHLFCRQFKSGQIITSVYSALFRKRVSRISFINSYKIR